jgi:hypothetical protein
MECLKGRIASLEGRACFTLTVWRTLEVEPGEFSRPKDLYGEGS